MAGNIFPAFPRLCNPAAFLGMVEGEMLDQELSLQVEQVRGLADLHTSPSPSHASGVEVAVRVEVAARMTHLGLG